MSNAPREMLTLKPINLLYRTARGGVVLATALLCACGGNSWKSSSAIASGPRPPAKQAKAGPADTGPVAAAPASSSAAANGGKDAKRSTTPDRDTDRSDSGSVTSRPGKGTGTSGASAAGTQGTGAGGAAKDAAAGTGAGGASKDGTAGTGAGGNGKDATSGNGASGSQSAGVSGAGTAGTNGTGPNGTGTNGNNAGGAVADARSDTGVDSASDTRSGRGDGASGDQGNPGSASAANANGAGTSGTDSSATSGDQTAGRPNGGGAEGANGKSGTDTGNAAGGTSNGTRDTNAGQAGAGTGGATTSESGAGAGASRDAAATGNAGDQSGTSSPLAAAGGSRGGTAPGEGLGGEGQNGVAASGDNAKVTPHEETAVGMVEAPGQRATSKEHVIPQTLGGMLPLTLGVDGEGEFDFDAAVVREQTKAVLDQLAAKLKTADYDRLDIVGHTDRIGYDTYNQYLSERRAWAVARYLNSVGIPVTKMHVEGRGMNEPLTGPNDCAPNLSRQEMIVCLQKDRRVVISASIRKTDVDVVQ